MGMIAIDGGIDGGGHDEAPKRFLLFWQATASRTMLAHDAASFDFRAAGVAARNSGLDPEYSRSAPGRGRPWQPACFEGVSKTAIRGYPRPIRVCCFSFVARFHAAHSGFGRCRPLDRGDQVNDVTVAAAIPPPGDRQG